MNRYARCVTVVLVLVLAAVGCSVDAVVGTSGRRDTSALNGVAGPAPGNPAGGAARKPPSVISAQPGATVGFNQPIVGDVDGDGLDDFLVQEVPSAPTDIAEIRSRVYLFYGRSSFAQQLSTLDADAAFEAGNAGAFSLGDVNGDGLAVFSIGQSDGFDIVFGSPTRLTDYFPAHSTDVTWTRASFPPPTPPLSSLFAVEGAGDVNGDHIADLLITIYDAAKDSAATDASNLQRTDYLVLGHRDDWKSGVWDPSWAAAQFDGMITGAEPSPPEFRVFAGGDLDGDGFADLLASDISEAEFVFYGGEHRLEGRLSPERADATFQPLPSGGAYYSIGDFDADGASDLAQDSGFQLHVVYGMKTRWAGTVSLVADLIVAAAGQPTDVEGFIPDLAGGEIAEAVSRAWAGDTDGDGAPELVTTSLLYGPTDGWPSGGFGLASGRRFYKIAGTAARALGAYHLSDRDAFLFGATHPDGTLWNSPASIGVTHGDDLSLSGDVDGDGNCDILAGGAAGDERDGLAGVVYLVPSTPRAPD